MGTVSSLRKERESLEVQAESWSGSHLKVSIFFWKKNKNKKQGALFSTTEAPLIRNWKNLHRQTNDAEKRLGHFKMNVMPDLHMQNRGHSINQGMENSNQGSGSGLDSVKPVLINPLILSH